MSMDYSDIGLDEKLRALKSDFQDHFEEIKDKVRGVAEDVIRHDPTLVRQQLAGVYNAPTAPNAGTINIGGANSGNGVISVKDAGGTFEELALKLLIREFALIKYKVDLLSELELNEKIPEKP